MAIDEKATLAIPIQINATAGSSSSVIVIAGSGAPDGNTAPWSDAKIGSVHIDTHAPDDTPPWYFKVDEDGADDDWVRPFIDLSRAALTMASPLTMDVDNKIFLRDTLNFIHSNAASQITLTAACTLTVTCGMKLGDSGTRMQNVLAGSATHVFGALAAGATSSESSAVAGLTQTHKIFMSPSSISGSLAVTGISCSPGGGVMVFSVANSGSEAFAGGNAVFGWWAVAACGA